MLLQLVQMKDCKSVLKNVFGYENFKSKIQEKAVIAICTGQYSFYVKCFLLLKTKFIKSFIKCYNM